MHNFFENEQGEAFTVYGDLHGTMWNEEEGIEEEGIGNISIQQDRAACHTAEAAHDVLRPVYEGHIISRRANVFWPPRSCDLTPLDKDKCYADKPETTDALKDNIREASGEILCCTQQIMCLKIGPIVQDPAWSAEAAI